MTHMRRYSLFTGSGIAVRQWVGFNGDILHYFVPEDLKRSEVPWVSIVLHGALRLEKRPPSVPQVTLSAKGLTPGALPDLPAGDYEYVCEGHTEHACVGAINAKKKMTFEDFEWKYLAPSLGDVVPVPQSSILVLAEGETDTAVGPMLIHAATRDLLVTFKSPGRALWAKAK
jgi:hypothetical protein